MMTLQQFAGLTLALLLAACSSAVEPALTYYRLDESRNAVTIAPSTARTLVIDRVAVADFLRQSGLVLQLGDNELQISRQHRWAESLDQALPRALQQLLQAQTQSWRVLLSGSDFIGRRDLSLRLQVNSFQLLANGEALLAGQYQLIDEQAGSELKAESFRLVADLQQDGYPHAVHQLSELLAALARQIVGDLPQ